MRKLINHFLILIGYTLINRHNHLVYWDWATRSQQWTNPKRKKPYSLDDHWRIYNG